MENEVFLEVLPFKACLCCLECQYLHQPYAAEDNVICLRTLETILHEVDFEIKCTGFEEIKSHWEPVYIHSKAVYR